MAINSLRALVSSFIPGSRLVDGGDCLNLFNLALGSAGGVSGLTALAGGAKPNATPLVAGINEATTVATGTDSFGLPQALPGTVVVFINDAAANSATIFGQQFDVNTGVAATISAHDSIAQTNNGIAVASAAVAIFFCFANGKWKSVLLT